MNTPGSVKSASRLGSSVSSGTKRKRAAEPKFYGVRAGHNPGVYNTWAECQAETKGFKKPEFRSFSSLTEAEKYIAGQEVAPKPGTEKFYAVKSGRVPGIYTDWPSASAQTNGWTKPKLKSFRTRFEAQTWLDSDDPNTPAPSDTQSIDGNSFFTSNMQDDTFSTAIKPVTAKKRKSLANAKMLDFPIYKEEDFDPGFGPLPPESTDGFDRNIRLDRNGELVYKTMEERQATKRIRSDFDQTQPIRVHTDGSSLSNGQKGARAGIGVWFGPGDKRNVSEPLAGPRQTNQRAELTAVQRAIEHVPKNRDILVVTDSKYAIDCLTNWFQNWRRNQWKTASGKAVENRDLVEGILVKIEERERLRVSTKFEWVKGHSTNEGNIAADKLALEGAKQTRIPTPIADSDMWV